MRQNIFVTGGTGFVGARLITRLVECGHSVAALARAGSEKKLPAGCEVVTGDALDASTFSCGNADTFVQLVGTARPAPWKGAQFRSVDLASLIAGVEAASQRNVSHFVYVSVAHPAPLMRSYIEVRKEGERIIGASGLPATILRPWYVLGPGRLWPHLLFPFYQAAEFLPGTRDGARRLGLLTREQMTQALVWAIENPPARRRVLNVPDIRALQFAGSRAVQ